MNGRPATSRVGLVVWLASLAGLALGLPYVAALVGPMLAKVADELPPLPILLLAQGAQTAVLLAIAAWGGAALAPKAGLRAPVFEALASRETPPRVPWVRAAAWGTLVGVAILAASAFFLPRLPEALRTPAPPWYLGLLAVFYGGVVEEVLLRWGALTLLLWLMLRVRARPVSAFWSANVIAAVLFGVGHLGTAAVLAGELTSWTILWVLLANGIAALAFGWLFRAYGLEAAMIAHATADVWLHVVAPMLM